MVLIDALKLLCNTEECVECEYTLDSGSALAYVAPQQYSFALAAVSNNNSEQCSHHSLIPHFPRRRLSMANGGGGVDEQDRWEGVLDFCKALDNAVEVDNEADLFADKRVLEFGFCTGLPSTLAFRHGAKSLCMYSWELAKLDNFVKPTLRRNNVPRSIVKFAGGDYENFKRTIHSQKYDVILAPEMLSTEESEFEQIHELLEGALSPDGIILFSARSHYEFCTGNLPSWQDLVKCKGVFDAHIRWHSPQSEVFGPFRRVVQMTRTIR